MEKRTLLAFALSVAVLLAYSLMFPPSKQPVEPKAAPEEAVTNTAPAPQTGQARPGGPDTAPVAAGARPEATPAREREVVVDTGLYTAAVSSRGGVIKSWRLKNYSDKEGRPVDMAYFEDGVKPLLVVPEGMTPETAGMLEYEITGGDLELSGGREGVLTLRHASSDGSRIVKELKFKDGTYAFGVDVKTDGPGPYELLMGESFGSLVTRADKGYGHIGFLTMVDGSTKKDSPDEVEGALRYEGAAGWASVTDKYFMGAVLPEKGLDAVLYKGVSDWGYVGARQAGDAGFIIYAGPKDYDVLRSVGRGLDQAVDFGWFSFIAKPLFVALKFFYDIVGNYGWSIIIITVIIKLLFAPLTHKQQKSMKRMQKLQPKIAELKEKYKGDAQKMNAEMMDLYKREKVNPLGGCLPMVIQIPVFIALYNVLNNAIELRQAPFMWWLTDLSAKDPYYILPVVMGVSMFAMQKMTPTTMDPKQAKIMMLMPVVLTFMFINLPSGLVLYFTLSNVLSMVQQLYINRTAEA